MDEHNKLISLSETDWHYRLVKYTFNIEGKIFMNLCPYFWLLVGSLFCVPFVWVFKIISTFFSKINFLCEKINNKIFSHMYDEFLKNLSEEQLSIIYYEPIMWSQIKIKRILPKYIKNEKDRYDILIDWASKRGVNSKKLIEKIMCNGKNGKIEKIVENLKLKVIEPSYKVKEKKVKNKFFKDDKEKAQQIIKFSKNLVGIIITLLFGFLALIISLLLNYAITTLIQIIIIHLSQILFGLGIVIGYSTGMGIIIYLGTYLAPFYEDSWYKISERDFKHINLLEVLIILPIYGLWSLIKFIFKTVLYKFLYKKIIVSLYYGTIEAIKLFGDIFGEYFGASYTDYCPGIEWEEKESNNN